MPAIHVEPVRTDRGRRSFVKFPWQVYKDDANWVPPLIPERLEYLDPERGLFYQHAEVALFAARRDGQTVGTIAPFVDRRFVEQVGEKQGGFGFFEVVEDYAVARVLLDTAHRLFTATLHNVSNRAAMTLPEFERLADQFRPFLDPNLALFADVDGESVGFCIASPDINRALIHLNGWIFPFGWLKLRYYMRRLDVVTFKLMGILETYRRRGIDALLYLQAVKAFHEGGYKWLDGSVTVETNPKINLVA